MGYEKFWMQGDCDEDTALLNTLVVKPLLAAVGASSDVERMHKEINIVKDLYAN